MRKDQRKVSGGSARAMICSRLFPGKMGHQVLCSPRVSITARAGSSRVSCSSNVDLPAPFSPLIPTIRFWRLIPYHPGIRNVGRHLFSWAEVFRRGDRVSFQDQKPDLSRTGRTLQHELRSEEFSQVHQEDVFGDPVKAILALNLNRHWSSV